MYDVAIAKRLMKVCQFVYDFPKERPPGATGHEKFSGTSADKILIGSFTETSTGALVRFPDMHVLAFSGTFSELKFGSSTEDRIRSLFDWIQNARASLHQASGFANTLPKGLVGRIHEGFGAELACVWSQVLSFARDNPKNLPLYVTGHSQGGALAALATACLAAEANPVKVQATYTIAAPRPGDAAFAVSVNTPVYRFEFGDDLVPHVPIPINLKDSLTNVFLEISKWASPFQLAAPFSKRVGQTLNDATLDFAGVGTLIYRREGESLQTDLTPSEEHELQLKRRRRLLTTITTPERLRNLVEHHHIAPSENTDGIRYESMLD